MPAVVPRKFSDAQRDYHAEIARLAELADSEYRINVCRQLYLVGTKKQGFDTLNPRADIWASLSVLECTDEERQQGWVIVANEHIPRNLTRDGLYWWIKELLGREPLWIFAD